MHHFDQIRTRLQNNAEGRLSELSAQHKLFLEFVSWEMASLYRELGQSNDAIEKRVSQRLIPDTATRAIPVHGLLQAKPKKAGTVLEPEEDIFTAQRLSQHPPYQIYFTPLFSTPVINGRVRYMASGQILEEVMGYKDRQVRLSAQNEQSLHPGTIWLGLELNEEPGPGEPLSFHIDMGSDSAEEHICSDLYSLISWRQNGVVLSADAGFPMNAADQKHISYPFDEEFIHLYNLEQQILKQYDQQFVGVKNIRQEYAVPEILPQCFGHSPWKEVVPEGLVWLELVLPHGFRPEDIQKLNIRLNCFPIVNRKIDKSQDFMPTQEQEIRSLSNAGNGRAALDEMGNRFLGIQKVFTRQGEYRPIIWEAFSDAPPGTYALQHGRVEANDVRDLNMRIKELLHLIRTYASALRLGAQHDLDSALRLLEDGSTALEAATQSNANQTQDKGYYLHLKVRDVQETIHLRFWITQGEFAKRAACQGEVLSAVENRKLEHERGVLISRTNRS